MIVSTIAMRGNLVSQATLYGGTTLQPLSQEGYISNNFAKLNNSNFPVNAIKLHIAITCITIGIWLIVPDVIQGITGTINHNDGESFITINTIISATSVFWIIIYVFVLAAILKYGAKGVINVS
jgi:L-asparagine transporter-like permease